MAKKGPDNPGGPRSRIDLDDVRVFAVVARTQSISAAARELRLTPGAVSRRLEELEGRLNARLLQRHANGVALTKAGRLALDKAVTIQRLGEEFERLLLSTDARPEGRVTIAAPDLLATYCVAPQVGAFLDARPGIDLVLDCGFWSKFPPPDPPDIVLAVDDTNKKLDDVWTPAATLHYIAAASSAYLAKRGKPATLAAIVDHRTHGNLSLNHQPHRWGERATAIRSLVHDHFLTNCGGVTVQAALGGAGIAGMPSYMLHCVDGLDLAFDEPFASVDLWIVHHRDAIKSAHVQIVIDWLLPDDLRSAYASMVSRRIRPPARFRRRDRRGKW